MVESVDNEISGVKRRMEEQLFYAAKKKREYSCMQSFLLQLVRGRICSYNHIIKRNKGGQIKSSP